MADDVPEIDGPSPAEDEDDAKVDGGGGDQKPILYYPTGTTLYVLNLPASAMFTYIQDLHAIFSKYGEIKCIKRGGVFIGKYGESYPAHITFAAYVYFIDPTSSIKALAENGSLVCGNPISVHVLKAGPNCAKVDNLPVNISEICLTNLFKHCGAVKEVKKIPERRIAFVEFENEEGINKAISLNGKLLVNNVKLGIERSKPALKKANVKQRLKAEKQMKRNMTMMWGMNPQNNGPHIQRGGGANRRGHTGGRGGARNFRGGGTPFSGGFNNWGANFGGRNGNNPMMNKRNQNDWTQQY